MSYTDCFNANFFKQPSSAEPYPIGSIIDIPVVAPANTNTAVSASVIGGVYTLPAGVWSIDMSVMSDIVGGANETAFAVDCIAYIEYKGTKVAQADSGWIITGLGAGTAPDRIHGIVLGGSVASDGTVGALDIRCVLDTGGGQQWTLVPAPAVGNSQFVRAVRVA